MNYKQSIYQKIVFLTSISLSVFFTNKVNAQQQYRMEYDYQTDQVRYFKLSKEHQIIDTLFKPNFKKNSTIEIYVNHVNPFALETKVDVKGEKISGDNGGLNIASLLGSNGGLNNLGMFLSPDKEEKSRGAVNQWSAINDLAIKIDAMQNSFLSDLSNPEMSKEAIIQNLKKATATITDQRLVSINNKQDFHLYWSGLKAIVQDTKSIWEGKIDKDLNNKLASRGATTPDAYDQRNVQEQKIEVQQTCQQMYEKVEQIATLYNNLESSTFNKSYSYEFDADKAEVSLKFTTKNQNNNATRGTESESDIRTRQFKIETLGGFKINTSVSIALTNFGANSFDYYIDGNGIVQKEANKYFTPNFGTVLNFYPIMSKNFNIGGSFGIAIPFAEKFKGINFLLGPALYLGHENKVSISGGIAFGPVSRLSKGIVIGQSTQLSSLDDYIKSTYDFGYYLGISFDLYNIK